jgi:hypothetical protein
VPEHPAGQAEGEVLIPELAGAGDEGDAAAAMAQTAPVVGLEETLAPESTEAGDERAAVAATTQMAPENVVPVVETSSDEEFGDSAEIDPNATASAAARIAEFISASEGVLGAGTSEGPPVGVEWAMVQHRVPSDFDRNEREEEEVWKALYGVGTQIQDALGRAFQLHQKMDFLISKVNAFP